MRVEVDLDLCEGNAECVFVAPELFELDEDVDKVIVRRELVPDELESAARAAVARCPRTALRLAPSE